MTVAVAPNSKIQAVKNEASEAFGARVFSQQATDFPIPGRARHFCAATVAVALTSCNLVPIPGARGFLLANYHV
jgi:hypothetical protein